MSLKIVPSAKQPFEAGSRVVFSMDGDDSCSDRVRSESVPLERRKCHWKAIRLSGPPESPVGFEVPSCFAPTVTVEFPVEPGEWLLTATNARRESFSLRYSVGGFPVKANPKKPARFRDLDPEVVLGRMRMAASGLERIESGFRCKPEVAEHTAVASKHSSIDQKLSRDSLKTSIRDLDALLAKSRGERRWALRVLLTPGGAANLGKAKARELQVFASRVNGVWSLTDWTSLGRQGAATIYANPRIRSEEWSKANQPATVVDDLRGAITLWRQRWPYEEGYLTIEGMVDGMLVSERIYIETPGKDAAKLAGFWDAASMVLMFAGFVVPPLMPLSMLAGATASLVRIRENAKQGKGANDNLLDVLFVVATATSFGKMAAGAASGMSRVASVATQVKGKPITYMTWADDLANGACFVMMTPEVFQVTKETLEDDSLTASQKLERLATGVMPYAVMGGILLHQVGGKRLVDFGKRVLDETMTIRPTELLPLEAHTNDRTNKTQMGRKKNETKATEEYLTLDGVEKKPMGVETHSNMVGASHKDGKTELFLLGAKSGDEEILRRLNMREQKNLNGGIDLFVHGSDHEVMLPDSSVASGYRMVGPEEFLQHIREKYGYMGGNINLLSCGTGRLIDGFAFKLAKLTKSKVWAPTDTLCVDRAGKMFVSSHHQTSLIEYPKKPGELPGPMHKKVVRIPFWPPDGEFKLFNGAEL